MEAHIEGSSDIYRAERKGGVCKHCKQDGDRLILFFDNHNFAEGRLLMELTIEYPDPDYSEDGIRQEHFIEVTPIQVVADNGDALDLRLPEPKVVERVVEKIVEVEKPVEKIVEKVVEKIIDNSTYTDLQKKAADWVSRMIAEYGSDQSIREEMGKVLSLLFERVGYNGLRSVSTGDSGFLFEEASSTDKDFIDKLVFAEFLLYGNGNNTAYLYSQLEAPEFNLDVILPKTKVSYEGLFYGSTLNFITISVSGTDYLVDKFPKTEAKLEYLRSLSIFDSCTANKVIVSSDSSSVGSEKVHYWYLLPSIVNSNVGCFEFIGSSAVYDSEYHISNIIEKFLPDMTEASHKPNLIFRDYTGEATEELKQIVLDKGYPSVEFYMNDTKVL